MLFCPCAPRVFSHFSPGPRDHKVQYMALLSERFPLIGVLRREFAGYNRGTFRADVLAGITVAAVALPLALAFGIASGADAAAGLVTAILAGFIIGGLGGAGFQIS